MLLPISSLLPAAEVGQLIDYNPSTGKFFWRPRSMRYFDCSSRSNEAACRSWNTRFASKEALATPDGLGYLSGAILSVTVKAHRAAFAAMTGKWPVHDVDHINGIRDDNRWQNLRLATRTENTRNQALRKNNSSGHLGVSKRNHGKWASYISVSGRRVYLGTFDNKRDAVFARKQAEKVHGYHENHGRGQVAL